MEKVRYRQDGKVHEADRFLNKGELMAIFGPGEIIREVTVIKRKWRKPHTGSAAGGVKSTRYKTKRKRIYLY